MTHSIIIRVSESEYSEIQRFVEEGKARTVADFVHTGALINIERARAKDKIFAEGS